MCNAHGIRRAIAGSEQFSKGERIVSKKPSLLLAAMLLSTALIGCAGVKTGSYAFNDSYVPN